MNTLNITTLSPTRLSITVGLSFIRSLPDQACNDISCLIHSPCQVKPLKRLNLLDAAESVKRSDSFYRCLRKFIGRMLSGDVEQSQDLEPVKLNRRVVKRPDLGPKNYM